MKYKYMTLQEAKNLGFTHHAEMYGIPIYYKDDESGEVEAKNKMLSYWLDFLIWIECYIGVNEDGFLIKIMDEL